MKNYKIQTISILSAFLLYAPSALARPDIDGPDDIYGSSVEDILKWGMNSGIVNYDAENGVLTFTPDPAKDGDYQQPILMIGSGGGKIKDDNVKKVVIGEGFTMIANHDWYEFPNLESVVIPSSMTDLSSAVATTFYKAPATAKFYCEDTSDGRCNSLLSDYGSRVQAYTKDENGVYDLGGTYYASLDNMTASAPSSCADMATCLASIGTHCNSAEECQTLLDMSSEGTNCNSLSSCKTYLAEHPSAGNQTNSALIEKYNGTPLLYGKKIYTVQEAEEALSDGTKFHVGLTYK